MLSENNKRAPETLEQGKRGDVRKRHDGRERRSICAGKPENLAASLQESLEREERPGLDAHGANRQHIERFVEFRSREKLLEPLSSR